VRCACLFMAQMRSADRVRKCLLFGVDWTYRRLHESDAFDAVDGAHFEASECHRVVALKCTTMRGAVHG
jgi:hypothetical protein